MKRVAAGLSLLLFSATLLSYLWWGRFGYYHSVYLALSYACSLLLVVGSHFYFADDRKDLGLRVDNFRQAALGFGGLTLGVGAVICLAGLREGRPSPGAWQDFFYYIGWAGLQQYALQNFLLQRARNLLGRDAGGSPCRVGGTATVRSSLPSVLLASGLFSLFHLPDPRLVALTLGAGAVWCLLFLRFPNFIWAWLSHATLGILVIVFLKAGDLGPLTVGAPGFRFEYYGHGVLVSGGYDAEGKPVVVTLPGPDAGRHAIVKVFSPEGQLLDTWNAFPGLDFSGRVAVGELGFGPGDEIVVAAGPGRRNPPLIRIFDLLGRRLKEIEVSGDGGYGALVSVSCGSLWLSPGPGPGAPATLVQLDAAGTAVATWQFEEFGFQNSLRGTGVCTGCLPRGEACARSVDALLLWGSEIAVNPSDVIRVDLKGGTSKRIETLPTTFGANVCTILRGGSRQGFAVAPGPLKGYPPWVRVFDLDGAMVSEFVAYDDEGACGANLGSVDVDGDGTDELIVGDGVGTSLPGKVRIHRLDGTLVAHWEAYSQF